MRQLQSANVHRNVVKTNKNSGQYSIARYHVCNQSASGHASADTVSIEERLFHEADNRDAIRERARRWFPALEFRMQIVLRWACYELFSILNTARFTSTRFAGTRRSRNWARLALSNPTLSKQVDCLIKRFLATDLCLLFGQQLSTMAAGDQFTRESASCRGRRWNVVVTFHFTISSSFCSSFALHSDPEHACCRSCWCSACALTQPETTTARSM